MTHREYLEQGMAVILKQYGAFFAFGKGQYDNHAQAGVEYIHLGSGLHVPKNNAKAVGDALAENARKAVQHDIDENGIDAIIRRELANHEYGYTWDITDTLSALEPYGVSAMQVKSIADSVDWSDY